MSYVLSKGRFPKNPDGTNILTKCSEDFRKFKDRNGMIFLEYLSILIKDLEKNGINPDNYKKQKENLEEIRTQIVKGEEKAAFAHFTRTFPYCMPHRSLF